MWDRHTGKPLHNAIVWLDNRTAGVCHAMAKQLGDKEYFRPGEPLHPPQAGTYALQLPWHSHQAGPAGRCILGAGPSAVGPAAAPAQLHPQADPPCPWAAPQSPACPSLPTSPPTSSSG